MTRQEEKKMLRSIMRRLEDKLSQRYMETADQAIMSHLAAMPEYQEAQTVFCFVSVRREIDTFPILKDALAAGKTLCIPLCTQKGVMEPRQITDLSQLQEGSYGLLEPPADAPLVSVDNIDFAILPCTTCNHLGQRLGKGGGYYDRFLSQYSGWTVGINYSECVRDELQPGRYDVPIQMLLTERDKLYFK